MLEALIFDMDGTLVDSEPLHHQAWEQALAVHGVESFSWEQFLVYIGTSNEKVAGDFIASAGLSVAVAELVRQKQMIYLELIPQIKLLPGVVTTMERLRGRFRLAVASSSHLLELQRILAAHDLSGQFEMVVGGDMVKNKKPDPAIYLETCRLLELPPARCLAFEDSVSGVQAAKSAGLTVIAVPNTSSTVHDYSRADLVITRLDQIDTGTLHDIHSSVRTRRSALT